MKPHVEIDNVGPIDHLAFDLSVGVNVLLGWNGSGKTTTQRLVQQATEGDTDVRLTKRDGAKAGSADICGKSIRITDKKTFEKGDLEVEGLENLSIADLHSPKFEKWQTRDQHRIKTLCRLAGAKADIMLFYDILGGQKPFEEIIPRDSMTTDDLLKMSASVKAAIEREGRRIEEQERSAKADALAQATIAKDSDTTLPCDEATLQQVHLDAVAKHAQLKEQRAAYRRTKKAADEATERLAKLPPGKSVREAQDAHKEASDRQVTALADVQQIRQQLRDAENALELADQAAASAARELAAANRDVVMRGELDAAIEAANGAVEITEDSVDDAAEAVGRARDAVSQGFAVRQAIAAEGEAKKHLELAKGYAQKAERLRDAAKEVQDVLTRAIDSLPNCPLKIKIDTNGDAQLVTATKRGPETPFDALSDGEKWLIVTGIAVAKNRLVVLGQSGFEGLSNSSRAKLHEAAVASGAYILTAAASDCDLTCKPYATERDAAE